MGIRLEWNAEWKELATARSDGAEPVVERNLREKWQMITATENRQETRKDDAGSTTTMMRWMRVEEKKVSVMNSLIGLFLLLLGTLSGLVARG